MNIARILALRPIIESLTTQSLTILKAELATGTLTGVLSFLQSDITEVTALVNFLDEMLAIKKSLGL